MHVTEFFTLSTSHYYHHHHPQEPHCGRPEEHPHTHIHTRPTAGYRRQTMLHGRYWPSRLSFVRMRTSNTSGASFEWFGISSPATIVFGPVRHSHRHLHTHAHTHSASHSRPKFTKFPILSSVLFFFILFS